MTTSRPGSSMVSATVFSHLERRVTHGIGVMPPLRLRRHAGVDGRMRAAASSNRATPLAATAVFLLNEHRACTVTHARSVIHHLLDSLCRHAECQHLYVSRAAQREADRLGVGDLSAYDWYQQKTVMRDPKRAIFHWDHFETVKELRTSLLRLKRPTERGVRRVLARASCAWILKREDQRLNDLGFKSDRPDPRAAYRKAKIRLIGVR